MRGEIISTSRKAGDAYVVTCGKGVHAGTSGRGGDFYAIEIPNEPTGIDDGSVTASPHASIRVSPNPSPNETRLTYSMNATGPARLTIHDVAGRLVARLIDERTTVGDHEVVWDGRDLTGAPAASGIYFARLETSSESVSRKFVLVR